MRGLLRKDFYMTLKYCRAYLLLLVVFLAVSMAGGSDMFFLLYPALFSGMIPVTLLAYDERSGWSRTCGTLPVTRAQVVSGKYVMGLLIQLAVLLLVGLSRAGVLVARGQFHLPEFAALLVVFLVLSCMIPAVTLPFMFRFGVEKGRVVYFVVAGIAGVASVAMYNLGTDVLSAPATPMLLPLVALICIGLYALSWCLSVLFYLRQEIR